MRIGHIILGFMMIIGSLMMLLNLPDYVSDEIRLIFLIVPIIFTIAVILKA